jgi:hypothetical protein
MQAWMQGHQYATGRGGRCAQTAVLTGLLRMPPRDADMGMADACRALRAELHSIGHFKLP